LGVVVDVVVAEVEADVCDMIIVLRGDEIAKLTVVVFGGEVVELVEEEVVRVVD
jgi:hypothetical protein